MVNEDIGSVEVCVVVKCGCVRRDVEVDLNILPDSAQCRLCLYKTSITAHNYYLSYTYGKLRLVIQRLVIHTANQIFSGQKTSR